MPPLRRMAWLLGVYGTLQVIFGAVIPPAASLIAVPIVHGAANVHGGWLLLLGIAIFVLGASVVGLLALAKAPKPVVVVQYGIVGRYHPLPSPGVGMGFQSTCVVTNPTPATVTRLINVEVHRARSRWFRRRGKINTIENLMFWEGTGSALVLGGGFPESTSARLQFETPAWLGDDGRRVRATLVLIDNLQRRHRNRVEFVPD